MGGQTSSAAPSPLTLIFHGTFAREESWWRPGVGPGPSFADDLEAALAARGMAGTVWASAGEPGFGPEDFSWSGRNRHRDRIAAARKNAGLLEKLAKIKGADAKNPLQVNLITHSHGGNVALEMLRDLTAAVRIRKLVLMGTPLISFRPAFRLGRLFLALLLLGLTAFLAAAVPLGLLSCLIAGPEGLPLKISFPGIGGAGLNRGLMALAAAPLMVPLYGLYFVATAWLLDFLWTGPGLCLRFLTGRGSGQAYGPRPAVLSRRLGGTRAVLLTSRQDEAEILIGLGTAPRKLYLDWVQSTERGRLFRMMEPLLFRPATLGVVLKGAEAVLEIVALGVSWWHALFFDYALSDLDLGRAYPPLVLEKIEVDDLLDPGLKARVREAPLPPLVPIGPSHLRGEERRIAGLKESLAQAAAALKTQVRLRHSLYYASPSVTARIADILSLENSAPVDC